MAREEVEGGWIIECDDCEDVEALEQVIDQMALTDAEIGKEVFGLVALMADTPYAAAIAEWSLRVTALIRKNAEASGIEIGDGQEDD